MPMRVAIRQTSVWRELGHEGEGEGNRQVGNGMMTCYQTSATPVTKSIAHPHHGERVNGLRVMPKATTELVTVCTAGVRQTRGLPKHPPHDLTRT